MSTIQEGLVITVNGICIVFGVLILIMLVLYAMRLFSGEKKQLENSNRIEPAEASEEASAQKAASSSEKAGDSIDEELVAVLTAAVVASMGLQSTYNLQIKSYRKIENHSPVWNAVSRRENLDNRL